MSEPEPSPSRVGDPPSEPSRIAPLKWSANERLHLERSARLGYPNEACGLLVGRPHGDAVEVVRLTDARNRNTERARDRYELDPDDYRAADAAARRDGLDVIGVWHTHPDHPARPSSTDLERAWSGLSYVIVSVRDGRVADVTSWRLEEERFVEQAIEEYER